MISVFAYQLPFSVCLLWLIVILFRNQKTHSGHLLAVVLGFLAVSFYSGANNLSLYTNPHRQVIMNIILEFSSLAVLPLVCFYIRSLADDVYERALAYLMLLPAILLTTANVVLVCLMGLDSCAELFYGSYSDPVVIDNTDVLQRAYLLISYTAYRILFLTTLVLAMIYMIWWLYYCKFRPGHIVAFLKGKKTSFNANILCVLLFIYFMLWGLCVVFYQKFLDITSFWSVAWSICTAVVLFLVGYVATVPPLSGGYMSMERLRHPFAAVSQTPQELLETVDSGPVADVAQAGYDKIMESFQELMVTNQAFQNPNITIDEIAHQLNTNRTYVSKLVNIYYGMPFRDYLGKLRMDFAKQLMLDEPDASIEYIAVKSGFQSSTQFIRKFKEHEDTTPAAWRNAQLHKTN